MEIGLRLTAEQEVEYKTVVLAGLLHDIGKFFQAGYGSEKNDSSPSKLTEWLIHGNPALKWPGYIKWLKEEDVNWVSFILSHHYESLLSDDKEGKKEKEVPPGKQIFAQMICEADYLSSGNRNLEKEYTVNPILAMFQDICDTENKAKPGDSPMKDYYYLFDKLSVDSLLPVDTKGDAAANGENYRNHIKDFIAEFSQELKRLPEPSFETIYYLLEKYLWCIPAPYLDNSADISLFHHLKTTTAITAALYKYFAPTLNELTKESIKNRTEVRFSLIQGDISGIQKFIYNVSAKGASRGLKGRSFYLQLLSDAVSRYILHELQLTVANLIYSSGGKFYILANRLDDTTVREFENHVNQFLFERFGGVVYFAVGKTDFNGEGLAGDFSKIWGKVNRETEKRKRNKFKHIMETDYPRLFEPQSVWGKVEFCSICGKEEVGMVVDEEKRKCESCCQMENIGAKLRKFNFLGESINGKIKTDVEFVFNNCHIGYNIYLEYPSQENSDETLYTINNTNFLADDVNVKNRAFKFYGGNEAPKNADDRLKDFDELAKECKGIQRLGILRMDVDNLGFLFQTGLPPTQRSLPMISTMSFYFDMFFQGYINRVLNEVKDSIYIVYSGGDDLFIIGPWNIIIEKSLEIRNAFSNYTAYNPQITLSAGIELIRPKYPISRGADMAGEAESQAKAFRPEKNGITFLGKTLSWYNFELCREIKELIIDIARENKGIINRLKQVYLLYKKNESLLVDSEIKTDQVKEKIFYNQWMWRMVYSLYRYAKDNDEKKVEIDELKQYLLNSVYKKYQAEGDAIGFLDIPARWAEFELRNENKEE
jgi:CRISPR-associated protein Csm1